MEQVEEEQWVREAAADSATSSDAPVRRRPRSSRSRSATACAACSTSLGVQRMVAGGQSMNPSTAQILEAVDGCNAEAVDRAAEQQEHHRRSRAQVDALTSKRVDVVPTTSVPDALAALVGLRPGRRRSTRTARR